MQATLDSLSGMNEFITKWKSYSFLRAHPLKNNHTPAKYKLIYSAHYNHFSLTQTTEGLDLKASRGSSCRKCLCVSSDGRRHSFLCSCNVFGRIMSPQNGISFTSLTGFSFVMVCHVAAGVRETQCCLSSSTWPQAFISGLTGPLSLTKPQSVCILAGSALGKHSS